MEKARNFDLNNITGIIEKNYRLHYEGKNVDWKEVCDRVKFEIMTTREEDSEEQLPEFNCNHPAGMDWEEYEELRPSYDDEMPSFNDGKYPPGFDPELWDL